MTTANKITILRILLIPFFVVELLYYVRSGNEIHRLLAILSFAITAILDGVDGYIARHYHQISELGKILDPLADKLLLLSGIVVLSFSVDGMHSSDVEKYVALRPESTIAALLSTGYEYTNAHTSAVSPPLSMPRRDA